MFSPLKIRKVPGESGGRQLFALDAPLAFSLVFNGGGLTVTVPDGFVTDFASTPRLFWRVFPPTGPWCEAAVVHDYLCGLKGCSRFLADAVFREAMYRLGVPIWRRVLMWWGVRVYGALFVGEKKLKA